jgi:hypothetical protein
MNVTLLIPDGPGVRNFILGSFLHQACRDARIDVLHAIPDGVLRTYDVSTMNGAVRWHALRRDGDNRLQEFTRNTLAYAHMYWADTGLMRVHLRRFIPASTWKRWAFTHAARVVGRAAASRGGIALLDQWHHRVAERAPTVAHYRRLFQELRPSVLFSSNQRAPEIVAPVLAARSLGIPTASFIFSWDNLTSKGRIAAPIDHFLVWSQLMRRELLQFYPDVSSDRVHIVGTPQFEPYADVTLLWPREEFFRRIGADPLRPLICYTGGDAGNLPQEPEYVRALMQLIRDGRIRGRPQVLLRPAPVDLGDRYDNVRADYPELLYGRAAWLHPESGSWADVLPLPEDVRFLANLTQHSDLNINFASTMTLDFAIHDKPVVNVAFDLDDAGRGEFLAGQLHTACDHYRPVMELGAARIAHSVEELAAHVNAYLANPGLDQEGRRRFVELEVGWPLRDSNRRIVEVLERIARKPV